MGIIQVVKSTWLEDCDRERREISILQRHVAYDLLLPKGLLSMLALMLLMCLIYDTMFLQCLFYCIL